MFIDTGHIQRTPVTHGLVAGSDSGEGRRRSLPSYRSCIKLPLLFCTPCGFAAPSGAVQPRSKPFRVLERRLCWRDSRKQVDAGLVMPASIRRSPDRTGSRFSRRQHQAFTIHENKPEGRSHI